MSTFAHDLRYAFRSLWHSKGFALVAILCLGVGIGINVSIFSVVDGVLIQSLPYDHADHLVVVNEDNRVADITRSALSYGDLRDLRDATPKSFTKMGAALSRSLALSDGQDASRYYGAAVSWDLFPMLGTQPILGRPFAPDDDRIGAEPVVLLSYDVWMERYLGDRTVSGRRVLINEKPYTIVGVMPRGFTFPEVEKLWIPLTPAAATLPRDSRDLQTYARLAPGVTIARASEDLASAAAKIAAAYPLTNQGWSASALGMHDAVVGSDVKQILSLMMAAATLVLFIACSNVANLLLARASVRRRELSIRAALGAGRGRIIRQLLTENVALSLASVPLGLLIASAGDRALYALMPPDGTPAYIHWEIGWRSVAYTLSIAIGTAVIFGLLPALQASGGNLQARLRDGGRGTVGGRAFLRKGLVVVQLAFALIALVGASLFARTFSNLDGYDLGFDPSPLMTMRFYMPGLPGDPYDAPDGKERRVQDVVQRIEGLGGVQAAFASNLVPLDGGGGDGPVVIDGAPVDPAHQATVSFNGVTPHFFRTLGVAATRGRTLTDAEGWSRSGLAVINQTMATRFWKDTDPIGRRFRISSGEAPDWFTVIGVIADVKQTNIDPSVGSGPSAYVPYIYQQRPNTGLTIRVAGSPSSIVAAARAEIRASDPNLPVFKVNTMETVKRLSFWQYGLFRWVFGTTGVTGLLLAAIGLYGMLSYAVAQRTQEIGVRMALGANTGRVLRLFVGQGLTLASIGVVMGLAGAAGAATQMRAFLYNLSPFDPLSFSGVALFLVVVAGLASLVPAWRATGVDPIVALRGE